MHPALRYLLVPALALLPLAAQTPDPDDAKIEPIKETISVNAVISADSPASIQVLGRPVLQAIPGVNLDDRLRAVPGFSMFRRQSSLGANPTTQGISLRGIGSSGASRSLLLWDGIPVNSPFGGWIYWTRIAPDDIDSVEISRGASTGVFGDKAMGGALNMFSHPSEPYHLTLGLNGGNAGQVELLGGISHVWKQRFAASARVRSFRNDGYYIVPVANRGRIDTLSNVEFVSGLTRLDYIGDKDKAFLRLDTLAEHRENGTSLTKNNTSLGQLAFNWTHQEAHDGISVQSYHTRERYGATFSAVGAGRATETLSFDQVAPSTGTGLAGIYRHEASAMNFLVGGDYQRVSGSSSDYLIPTGIRFGEGTRNARGFFGQANAKAGPVKLFLGLRQDFTGGLVPNNCNCFFSPSGGLSWGTKMLRLRGSAYRSFRAPTLNELYRTFRAGNAVTNANGALRPETLFGSEVGADLVGETRRASITFFRNEIDDLITNVTLSTTPALITRQRQNAASALSRGIEASVQQNWHNWRGELTYLFVDSRYLNRLRIAQVPKQQGSARLTWQHAKTMISGNFRVYSMQFEDDINTLPLGGFTSLQFSARQELRKSLVATFEMDNALDRVYLTGRTPAFQIGAPRLVRVGLQWNGPFR